MRYRPLVVSVLLLGILVGAGLNSARRRSPVSRPAPASTPDPSRPIDSVTPHRGLEEASSIVEVHTAAPVPTRRTTNVVVRVRDLFGRVAVGTGVGFGFGDEGWDAWHQTDWEGGASHVVDFNPGESDRSWIRVQCGDALIKVARREGRVEIEFPHADSTFGELAIQPAGWHGARIRLTGEKNWSISNATDSDLGQRFLFVTPGEYEITDDYESETVIGRMRVVANQRSTYRISGRGAIQVTLIKEPHAKVSGKEEWVRVRGLSALASFGEGVTLPIYGVGRTFFGLEPGLYEVSVCGGETLHYVELRGGEIAAVNLSP